MRCNTRALLLNFIIILQCFGIHCFIIIPDELPSLMSVIYSNIPTIKKGTDSRIGWGFRMGNRADFQVLLELGPQTNTQPLANQNNANNNKRNAPNTLRNVLYAEQQRLKKTPKIKTPSNNNDDSNNNNTNGEGASWLKQWSESMQSYNVRVKKFPGTPGLGIGEIDAKSVIPDDSLFENLNKNKSSEIKGSETAKIMPQIAAGEENTTQRGVIENKPLDDVSLDDDEK